jgi:hypothetical protein
MADIIETPAGVNYYPQDASIDDLSIVTTDGKIYTIKGLMTDLSYFEDIYTFVISGYVTLRDASGLIENLQLTGKESIVIDFDKSRDGPRKSQTFRLYSIPSRKPVGNLNSEYIKLYFCSEELLLSEQTKITKSYSAPISDIITNILTEKLKVTKQINIQETTGTYDFNIPTLKPLEAISWLSIYARPKSNELVGADMLFFETKDAFNFMSLSTMYQQPVYKTYKYQQQNLNTENYNEKVTSVLDFEFIKSFNALEDIDSGTFANRLISLDPLTRTQKITDFDYSKYRGESLNGNGVLTPIKNRLGETQNQAYKGKLKLAISNSEQKKKDFIASDTIAQDIFLETFVPNRTAQIALANYTIIKFKIPGDPLLTAGKVIDFQMLSLAGGKDRQADKFYSGKYLVTAVRHIIKSEGGYQTVVEIAKESTTTAYSTFYNNPLM